jgi:hypothetical protein
MRILILVLSFLISCVSLALPAHDDNRAKGSITNLDVIAKALNLDQFKGRKFTRKIRIAILDTGFAGYKDEIGKSLPADTRYEGGETSATDNDAESTNHGIVMAKIVNAVIKKSGADADYHLHLFYAYGNTKLEDAVNSVIKENYDLVVYAVVWPIGGNGDGHGEVNTIIKRATDAGIIWINAAGNYGQTLRAAPVKYNAENWVLFEDKGSSVDHVTFTCKVPANAQSCRTRIFLNWNVFTDENMKAKGTDKNLDLYIYDSLKDGSAGNLVDKSTKIQVTDYKEGDRKTSPYPFEKWSSQVGLAPGTYQIKVKVVSSGFDEKKDSLRVFIDGPGLTMEHPTLDENLLNPADNLDAIVAGAAGDPDSSRSVSRGIPQILLNSKLTFSKSDPEESSSMAAALAGGFAALELGMGVEKKRGPILEKLQTVSISATASAATAATIKATPTATTAAPAAAVVKKPRKIVPRRAPAPSRAQGYDQEYAGGNYGGGYAAAPVRGGGNPWVAWVFSLGGATITSDGYHRVILISYDARSLIASPLGYDEVVVIGPDGMFATPASDVPGLPPDWYIIQSRY